MRLADQKMVAAAPHSQRAALLPATPDFQTFHHPCKCSILSKPRKILSYGFYLVMKWHFMFNDLSQSNKSGCEMFDQFEPKSQVTKLAYFFNFLR